MRPSWDDYFLDVAKVIASRADCDRLAVGAVLVKEHRIVSTGYNGVPAGDLGCSQGWCPRRMKPDDPESRCNTIHAEANALLYADRPKTEGATLYVTCEPCERCDRLLRAAGVIRVVTP